MRTILFRAKRVDNNEWVIGSYLHDYKNWAQVIATKTNVHEINPETVGQFTGVNDKNGLNIFEHDIIKYERQLPFQNMFEINQTGGEMVEVNHVVEYFLNGTEFSLSPISYNELMNESLACCRFMEVIGNVHDNPELLNTSF